ncbi:MAG: cobalt ECF transporter T component CbiQ [Chloroflexota bacterium]|nr:cobalt ECF transporter T component CbiQ [Chloroflexota bacterium]
MIQYPEIDRYADLTSPIHRWDPRAKLVATLCLILSVVLVPDVRMALVGLTIAIGMVIASRLPTEFVLKRITWVGFFIIPLFLLILLTRHEGKEIANIFSLTITSGSLEQASLIAVRALAAVILLLPMIATMKFDTTIKALEKLRVPGKLTQLILFTYRYIFVLIDEAQTMSRSLASRGFERKLSIHMLTTNAKLIGMLFIRSYERAERVHHAMVSRGYDGNFQTMTEFKLCKLDIAMASILISLAIALNACCVIGI